MAKDEDPTLVELAALEKRVKAIFDDLQKYQAPADQIRSYEESLKHYRDLKNSLDTAREEGISEGYKLGLEKRAFDVAKKMLQNKMDDALICSSTGLTLEQVQQLKSS